MGEFTHTFALLCHSGLHATCLQFNVSQCCSFIICDVLSAGMGPWKWRSVPRRVGELWRRVSGLELHLLLRPNMSTFERPNLIQTFRSLYLPKKVHFD